MAAKKAFRTLIMVGIGLLLAVGALAEAQEIRDRAEVENVTHRSAAVVGSWLETVAVKDGPTFKSLVTYSSDGSRVSSDQGNVITEGPFPHVFSAGHGPWVHQRGRVFTSTFVQLISDLTGALLFVNTVQETVTLDRSKDTYRSVWTSEFTDPSGNLFASFEGTSDGERLKAGRSPARR